MKLSLTLPFRLLFVVALILIVYGYVCRWFNIYFFWESRSIGCFLIMIPVIAILLGAIKRKKMQGKKRPLEIFGFWMILFFQVMAILPLFIFPATDAYEKARAFIASDERLRNEVGAIKSVTLIPNGSISIRSYGDTEEGVANFQFIIKGEKRYADLKIGLMKTTDSDWQAQILDLN